MLTLRAGNNRRAQDIMTEVFVIGNQLGHFWGKKKTWVDGSDARVVRQIKHRDEATNTLFELSSKDFELRGNIIAAELNERGNPQLKVSDIPLPEVPVDEATAPDVEPEAAAHGIDGQAEPHDSPPTPP
jgi:hypothetical protein